MFYRCCCIPVLLLPSQSTFKNRVKVNVLGLIAKKMSLATSNFKCMFDEGWLSVLLDNQMICNELTQLKFRHVPTRFITRITPNNLEDCTRLMKYVDLRHFEDIIGYLGITDYNYKQFVYISALVGDSGQFGLMLNRADLVVSSNQSFGRMQNYLFDRIWDLAIPAIHTIAAIQRKVSPQSIRSLCFPIESIEKHHTAEFYKIF
jgi:hypothetical protein